MADTPIIYDVNADGGRPATQEDVDLLQLQLRCFRRHRQLMLKIAQAPGKFDSWEKFDAWVAMATKAIEPIE